MDQLYEQGIAIMLLGKLCESFCAILHNVSRKNASRLRGRPNNDLTGGSERVDGIMEWSRCGELWSHLPIVHAGRIPAGSQARFEQFARCSGNQHC